MTNDKKRCAFTLAEIMITIGIIGIVAAITIPTMIQNSNSKKFATQLKKSVSTLNQASIGAQAQYDVNYSMMSTESDSTTCGSDSLARGNLTICGLLNTTLAGHTYLGVYGQDVKSASGMGLYTLESSTFNPDGFLIYSFSDGAFVGFNPNAINCSVGAGKILTTEMLTESLANCIGFIDVNGPTTPNREVKCKDEEATALSATASCQVTKGTTSDIYPIVFHDGTVEVVSNAAKAIYSGGSESGAGSASSGGGDNQTAQEPEDRRLTLNGIDYVFKSGCSEGKGCWHTEDENGDLSGKRWIKQEDGTYISSDGEYICDEDMNILVKYFNGIKYFNKGNGLFLNATETKGLHDNNVPFSFTKNSDGTYQRYEGSYGRYVVYDADFNILGSRYSRTGPLSNTYINGKYVEKVGENYRESNGTMYYKQEDGTYQIQSGTKVFDENLALIKTYVNGDWYTYKKSNLAVRKDGENYVTSGGDIYTKRDDGLYQYNGYVYDEELRRIGPAN